MDKVIKRGILSAIALIVVLIICFASVNRVDVGFVGVKVKLAGSDSGVQDAQLRTGWVWFNPIAEQVVEFPVSIQNVVWTNNPHEGLSENEKPTPGLDESLTFTSQEGINAAADISMSFHIEPSFAPKIYVKFKKTDMHDLAYGYMRTAVREAFNDVATKMPIQDIYGSGKSRLVADVTEQVRRKFEPDGIVVDQLAINGALRLPPNVQQSIDNAIAATQQAIQSENRVRQVKAEAEQAVAQAKGAADSAREKAQGDADATLIKAKADAQALDLSSQAEAKANRTVAASVTGPLISYLGTKTWNGALPTYMGGGGPVPFINVGK